MLFHEIGLPGAYLIELEKRGDERGFFARMFCQREFADRGLVSGFVQANDSLSANRGTLRGLHYQLPPHAETKVVRCVRGAIWDCVLDLRSNSETFGNWFGAELSAEHRQMMYVPQGCAHGFITMTDSAEAIYFVDQSYAPHAERIVRWDDPRFAVKWPFAPATISDKDAHAPDFNPAYHLGVKSEE
jgi:dTDP-4-dehydrorhamnose 3,5-epimerase